VVVVIILQVNQVEEEGMEVQVVVEEVVVPELQVGPVEEVETD
jgi:hypothetical protein